MMFACSEVVNLKAEDSLPDYADTHKKRCPKCGYEWIYRGEGKTIKCNNCSFQRHSSKLRKEYYATYYQANKEHVVAAVKIYQQTPKYKAKKKLTSKLYRQTPECRAYMKAYRARKKAERLAGLTVAA